MKQIECVYTKLNITIFITGTVNRVEIKHKKAPASDEVQNTFAFITIGIDDFTLRRCLQEFKEQQYRGRYLQVTVARENFLEKLKREREEAAQHQQNKEQSVKSQDETVAAVLPTISTGKSDDSESSSESSEEEEPPTKSKTIIKQNGSLKYKSSEESSESESEIDEENLILKKKSKIFLENGKVK